MSFWTFNVIVSRHTEVSLLRYHLLFGWKTEKEGKKIPRPFGPISDILQFVFYEVGSMERTWVAGPAPSTTRRGSCSWGLGQLGRILGKGQDSSALANLMFAPTKEKRWHHHKFETGRRILHMVTWFFFQLIYFCKSIHGDVTALVGSMYRGRRCTPNFSGPWDVARFMWSSRRTNYL